jgi:hypothetical protein
MEWVELDNLSVAQAQGALLAHKVVFENAIKEIQIDLT